MDLIDRLPTSLEIVRVLARRPDEVVLQARLDGDLVAVRAMAQPEAAALVEWSALQAVHSDGVASIRGWGPIGLNPQGEGAPPEESRPLSRGIWLARQWIEGESLEVFARTASDEQLASAAADVFGALEEVHAAGIVHGDLSPGNIIVGIDGKASLTDFGLSSSLRVGPGPSAGGARRSGTPLFIAPEVLVGAAPSPASDHFGAAAVFALALARVQVNPARFYGRFPAEPFLDAAEIPLSSLPSWSRELLSTLLSREPSERSAGSGLKAWRSRLERAASPELGTSRESVATIRPLSFLVGRNSWVQGLSDAPPGLILATSADDSESQGVLDAAAVHWLCSGRTVHKIDLRRLSARARSTLDLDRLVVSELQYVAQFPPSQARPGMLLVAVMDDDEWTLEAVNMVAHAAISQGNTLVVAMAPELRHRRVAGPGSPWSTATLRPLPPLRRDRLFAEMGERLVDDTRGESGHVEEFVDRVDQLGRGSVARVNMLLRSAAELGAFEAGAAQVVRGAIALRPTFVPAALIGGRSSEVHRGLTNAERELLALILLLGGVVPMHQIDALVEASRRADIVQRLKEAGVLSSPTDGLLQLVPGTITLEDLGLPISTFQRLHRVVLNARVLAVGEARADALEPDFWVHAIGAATGQEDPLVSDVEGAVEQLERKGLRTRIARGLRVAREVLESEKRPLPASLMAELARALARCSDASEARRVAALSGSTAVASEVEGILQHLAGHFEASAKSFHRSGRPLRSLVQQSRAALERGELSAFDRALKKARSIEPAAEAGGDLAWIELLGLASIAAERRDDAAHAWSCLDHALEVAAGISAPQSEAAMRVTRAGLARRRGELKQAYDELEHGRRIYRSIGSAAGEAQVQSVLGTLLKDEGRWLEAEQPLLSALGRRERLGQLAPAAMTRGTLGLLFLERGHLRRAIDELSTAREQLGSANLMGAHTLLSAALDLARARVGLSALGAVESTEGDPRVAAWRSQAAGLRGGAQPASGTTAFLLGVDQEASGERQVDELLEDGRQHGELGLDALAARYAIEAAAVAGAHGLEEAERSARRVASVHLNRVLHGLTNAESHRAEETLLGIPDPNPRSIEYWRADETDEMDAMKILELNERLIRQEDSSQLLGAIVEAAKEISGAERGFIVMSKDGVLELDTAFDSSRGEINDEDVDFSRSIVEEALEHRRSLRISDAAEHEEWGASRSVEDLRLRSILVAPFFVSPRVAGVVVVDDRRRPGAFGPREQRLVELLGGQASLAMRQVLRLEENRSLAAELRLRVASQNAQLEQATRALDRAGVAGLVDGLVGDSRAMEEVRAMIHRVARADITTLVTGPSGSGKEVAARALHAYGSRKGAPFVAENCAALPPSLAEAELFGVKKGAFTGADVDREGLFERADGGTLFLDEIGELPLELQAKLLRVLETRRVRRVGETDERAVDFRLISATNRDLDLEVDAGRFRADLMYRLDGVTIQMPPLSERREDIPELVTHFLAMNARDGGEPKSIDAAVLRRLIDRAWPGNVRELANEVERLCVLSGARIDDPQLVREPWTGAGGPRDADGSVSSPERSAAGGRVRTIAELERIAILDALAATGDDKRKAAELLGISRAKIYQRIKEWGDV